jgi:hypothetical protein
MGEWVYRSTYLWPQHCDWSASRPGTFTPGERTHTHTHWILSGLNLFLMQFLLCYCHSHVFEYCHTYWSVETLAFMIYGWFIISLKWKNRNSQTNHHRLQGVVELDYSTWRFNSEMALPSFASNEEVEFHWFVVLSNSFVEQKEISPS